MLTINWRREHGVDANLPKSLHIMKVCDLLTIFDNLVCQRGPHGIVTSKLKGHADPLDAGAPLHLHANRAGNIRADNIADNAKEKYSVTCYLCLPFSSTQGN